MEPQCNGLNAEEIELCVGQMDVGTLVSFDMKE